MGTATPETAQDQEEDTGGARTMDPEIRTIGKILRILDDLDHSARCRVICYLSDRFQPS